MIDKSMTAFYHGMTNDICVLLIDEDNKFACERADLLKSYEYKVRTVNTASQGMLMLSKGKEKIDLMIINMNTPDLHSFQLLEQAVACDIVSICVSDTYDASSAKKAFESGAYLYLQKSFHQEFVKYMWQFVLQKKILKGKAREGLEENSDYKHIDDIINNNIVGGNEEQYVEENNVLTNTDEQSNDIHETTNDVVSNEKSKLRRKRGGKLTEEEKSQSSTNKIIVRRKARIVWTDDLHGKFLEAMNQLDDDSCFPNDILRMMNVPDLTRYQVASHLQKYLKNIERASKEKKSTRRSSSQLRVSNGSIRKSSLRKFETTSHFKMNVTNLQQQQYDQETQRGPKIPYVPNNNIIARGESSTLQKLYHPQLQVDPQYLNPFDTPFLSSTENNNIAGLQQQQGPLSELLGLQGLNNGSAYYTPRLEFNNGIQHAQNDYAMDVATDYTENSTINGLGAENINFQQHIGEQNMSQPANNIVTTSHVSDTQESESSETMDYNAYFDFSDIDSLFQNYEPPSFNLPNEGGNEFDQIYSNDLATSSAQFSDITNIPDDSST